MSRTRALFGSFVVCLLPFAASCQSGADEGKNRAALLGKWQLTSGVSSAKDRAVVEFLADGTFVTDYFETDAVVSRTPEAAQLNAPGPVTKVVRTLHSVKGEYRFVRDKVIETGIDISDAERQVLDDTSKDGYQLRHLGGPMPRRDWFKFIITADGLKTASDAYKLGVLVWTKVE